MSYFCFIIPIGNVTLGNVATCQQFCLARQAATFPIVTLPLGIIKQKYNIMIWAYYIKTDFITQVVRKLLIVTCQISLQICCSIATTVSRSRRSCTFRNSFELLPLQQLFMKLR